MKYTAFGKVVRKLMIDRDENLKDIAKLFDVSAAFVSLVLGGKKQIPDGWLEKLSLHYSLDEEAKKDFYNAYCNSKNIVRIDLINLDLSKRKLAIEFKKKLKALTDSEVSSIFQILKVNAE